MYYYPISLTKELSEAEDFYSKQFKGISIRDKMAHDYMKQLISKTDIEMNDFDSLIESCFTLADKMIEKSKTI